MVLLAHSLGALMAAATVAYLMLATWCVLRFREGHDPSGAAWQPPISVLVPLHGAPPGLDDCLRSASCQRYPDYQLVFGLHRADDPARAVIERVMAEHPGRDVTVVVDTSRAGSNPKMCNLINMYPAARHDVIAMIDSDVLMRPDCLQAMVAPLRDPRVGATTCTYTGVSRCRIDGDAPREDAGCFASDLGALHVNEWFLPSTLVDVRVNGNEPCFGAAVMTTRAAIERTGGLVAHADAVAEDDAMGIAHRDTGHHVRVVAHVVATIVAESGLRSLWRHELRWMRSVRAYRPRDHALAGVMYTVPALALLLPGAGAVQLALAAALAALRLALHAAVRTRFATATPRSAWLVPVRECFGFAVWAASFVSRRTHWGGQVLHAAGARATRAGTSGGE